MSLAMIVQTDNNLFIGSDSAIGKYYNKEYVRVDNNYQKIKTYKNLLYFIAGKLKYSNFINENIDLLYSDSAIKFSDNIKELLSDYEFKDFDFEMIFAYLGDSKFYQISSYDSFEFKKYTPIKNSTSIYCVGFDNKQANNFAINNFNNFNLFELYQNVFKKVNSAMIGGTLSIFDVVNNLSRVYSCKIDEEKINNESIGSDELLVVGDVIVGSILAGNNLRIANTNNNFLLDESGATLTDATFTLTTSDNKGRIILDTEQGIKIQNNSTGDFTDGIYLGTDGRIKAQYLDITGDSTFGGTLNAVDGVFKGTLEGVDGTFTGDLSAAGGTFSGDLNAVGGNFTGTLNGVDGNFEGNLEAVGGTFNGTLVGVDGEFTGSLKAGISIEAPNIIGGTIIGTIFQSEIFSGYDGVGGEYLQRLNIINDEINFDRHYTNPPSGVNDSYYSISTPRGGTFDGNFVFGTNRSVDFQCNKLYYNGNEVLTKGGGGDFTVVGDLTVEGDTSLNGYLKVKDYIRCDNFCRVNSLESDSFIVASGSISANGNISGDDFSADGHIRADSYISAWGGYDVATASAGTRSSGGGVNLQYSSYGVTIQRVGTGDSVTLPWD